jgi:hypothetical protein
VLRKLPRQVAVADASFGRAVRKRLESCRGHSFDSSGGGGGQGGVFDALILRQW